MRFLAELNKLFIMNEQTRCLVVHKKINLECNYRCENVQWSQTGPRYLFSSYHVYRTTFLLALTSTRSAKPIMLPSFMSPFSVHPPKRKVYRSYPNSHLIESNIRWPQGCIVPCTNTACLPTVHGEPSKILALSYSHAKSAMNRFSDFSPPIYNTDAGDFTKPASSLP